jgi:hypothetical protein
MKKIGSGRTIRMLKAAIQFAHGKEAANGMHVLIVAYDDNHRRNLVCLTEGLEAFMPKTSTYTLYPTSCCASMIEFKTLAELIVDWTTLKVSATAADIVLFDHFTIEAGLAKAIHEINRFDL